MNSLPEHPTAAHFLQASLQALSLECPQAYQAICRQLSGKQLLVEIDGEAVGLSFSEQQAGFLPLGELQPPPRLRLSTTWQAILDLLDARLTLQEAVLSSRLDLAGPPGELVLLYDAMLFYLRGGVRTFAFPLLLQELRKTKQSQPG